MNEHQQNIERELDTIMSSFIRITQELRNSNIINLHGVVIGLQLLEVSGIMMDIENEITQFFQADNENLSSDEAEAENANLTAVVE